jgi:RimJ/RimL family protein N-acetyltransferase
MSTVLWSERLELRFLTPADVAAQYAIYSDPDVMRYWSSAAWTTMQQAEESVAASIAACADGSGMRFAFTLRETGELIGNCTLYNFFPQNRRADVGYALARAHWGKGYMREALSCLLDHAFGPLELHRIEADIDPRNEASRRLLESLGFQREGYLRERWFVNGEICDTVMYGLLARDWQG